MADGKPRWIDLPHARDQAGGFLTAIEAGQDVPFSILRAFYMYGTPPGVTRGGHAHADTQQIIVAVSGALSVELCDESSRECFRLDDPNRGVFMPPLFWVRLYDFSADCVCLVLADTHYDPSTLIREWDEFLVARKRS
jgi:dTDP-4-dehydrorhamnose 3,5-epimerase-like enzyme